MEAKSKSTPLITYIHEISGQLRRQNIIESEHAYAKFWNRHPDPSNKSRPARFLFMQSFARWSSYEPDSDIIDVDTIDDKLYLTHPMVVNPLVAEVTALTKGQVTITEEYAVTDSAPNKSTWSNLAQRIWAKALNILYTDRLLRLSIEGTPNEIITKKMISHKCANKFRHLFASLAFWDPSILSWLHATLLEHVSGQYLIAYHESMQLLRSKFPSIVDRFYLPPVHNDPIRSRNKGPIPDPIQNVLNNHKPKRIKNCPLFILVPNGPQATNSIIPQRLKHWQLLFASLGKIITLSINYRPTMRVKECLNEIMIGVRDKITECRTTFTEGRPIILVGFGHSSLIAAHVALDPTCKVTATICLGFPLAGVNGFRGDLDDPLLDTTVPTLFVIGQNATLSSIDDVEDFRERITKTETGLVVVGGANDHLVVSQTKQRFTGITQAIVDRCISDEIYDFINFVMNPHFVPSENNYVSAAAKNLSKTPPGAKGDKPAKSKPKTKMDKQTIKETVTSNLPGKLGILSRNLNDPLNSNKEIATQSTVGVNTETMTGVTPSLPRIPSIGIDARPGLRTGIGGDLPMLHRKTTEPVPSSGPLGGIICTPKAKSKPKKSRPKSKKKEEPKRLDEANKMLFGKLDKEGDGGIGIVGGGGGELTSIDRDINESKHSKDLKETKESKQAKDKKEGDKESKEGKPSKESKTSKEKENKKRDSGPTSSMTSDPLHPLSAQVQSHHHQHQNQHSTTLPPPLLTAPTLLESGISSSTISSNSTHSNVTPSPPPPLITAPSPYSDTSASGLHSKRKKTSTSKYDPDGSQPAKKKKEELSSMSISSIEKIERTLDEVIATSIREFEPSPTSSSLDSTISTPQSDKHIRRETSQQFDPITSTQQTLSASASSSSSLVLSSLSTTSNATATPTASTSTTSTTSTTLTSLTGKSSTNVNRDYVFSYEVSEVTTLPPSSSNTRTRTIRAPKQLDI